MNLADIIGRLAHVVLNEVATFEHCNLGEVVAYLHAHQIATDRTAVALATTPLLKQIGIELGTTPARATR